MVNNKFWLVGFALAVPSASFIFNALEYLEYLGYLLLSFPTA